MSTLTYPNTLTPNTTADANQVMANFNAAGTVVNGNLESSTNVKTAVPIAQTSASILEGSSASLARADHSHVVRSFEQLTADPTTNNFVGRCYNNTSTTKIRMCINAGGSGTWITIGNLAAADLPAHALSHTFGSDLLSFPGCLAQRTTTQSLTSATDTVIAFNAADAYDTDSMHDTVTNNSRLTVNTAGVYHVWGTASFAANNTGARRLGIVTGAGAEVCSLQELSPGASTAVTLTVSGTVKLTATAYVELHAYQNSGGALNIQNSGLFASGGPQFGACWLGTGA